MDEPPKAKVALGFVVPPSHHVREGNLSTVHRKRHAFRHERAISSYYFTRKKSLDTGMENVAAPHPENTNP